MILPGIASKHSPLDSMRSAMKAVWIAAMLAAAAFSALATPVYAEESESMKQAREVQERRDAETDRAYKAAVKNTSKPEKPVKGDPWATARDPSPKK
ncbi:MAG: hypothetical protein ACR2K5_11265 [Pseudolabrys sp.]